MPQSLSQLWTHIVFSTKGRAPYLNDLRVESEIHAYIRGVCREMGSPIIEIGGTADHVHVLLNLSRNVPVCKVVQNMKKYSCAMARRRWHGYEHFAWQRGYGAFTVSPWAKGTTVNYIANQKLHHRVESFMDEYRKLLACNEVSFDERYVWD